MISFSGWVVLRGTGMVVMATGVKHAERRRSYDTRSDAGARADQSALDSSVRGSVDGVGVDIHKVREQARRWQNLCRCEPARHKSRLQVRPRRLSIGYRAGNQFCKSMRARVISFQAGWARFILSCLLDNAGRIAPLKDRYYSP